MLTLAIIYVFFTFVTSYLVAEAYIYVVINIHVRHKVLKIYIFMPVSTFMKPKKYLGAI